MYEEQNCKLTAEQLVDVLLLARSADIAPGPGGSRITPLPSPADCTWAVVALYPSSQLVCHCDPPIAGIRYHVPLHVNGGCWCFHAGVWQQLEVGRYYLMDPTKPHGAVNWGTEVRLHLMIDTNG